MRDTKLPRHVRGGKPLPVAEFTKPHDLNVHRAHSACQAHCAEPLLDGKNPWGEESPMWTHLKAWRERAKLSQVNAGLAMGVSHTTIGRWEKGKMSPTIEQFAQMAKIYGATPIQLQYPPKLADITDKIDRTNKIVMTLETLRPNKLEQWLAIGDSLCP